MSPWTGGSVDNAILGVLNLLTRWNLAILAPEVELMVLEHDAAEFDLEILQPRAFLWV